jgi:hypothetical protein
MSEGERVVFAFTGDDRLVRKGEFYTDQRDARHGVMLANKEGRFIESFILRRIPDPVPGLEARIAELEGEVSRLGDQIGRTVDGTLLCDLESGLCPDCGGEVEGDSFSAWCHNCDGEGGMPPKHFFWSSVKTGRKKPPTPAAAKEQ